MYQHAQPEYPQQPQEEELQEEQPKLVGEVDELFNILMGKETAKEEEILPDSFQEHQPQDELQQEMLQQEQLTRQLLQQEPETREPDPVDEVIPVSMGQMVEEQVESQTEQMGAMEEPEPESGNKFKKLIKANPKEAVVLSEILTPKFKEYN